MSPQEDGNFSHKIYKNDPALFSSYVGKEIRVTAKDGNVYCGIIYTVDPVSESVVLLQPKEDTQYCLKIISGHMVKDVEVTSETKIDIPELFLPTPTKLSSSAITERKTAIMQLLTENRIAVTEDGDVLLIEGALSINPPYYPENCTCTNSIILTRIQNILKPTNVE